MNRNIVRAPSIGSSGATLLAAIAGGAIGWGVLGADASAQGGSLGGGSALSKNLGKGGGGSTSSQFTNPALRSSVASQARLNNAIVTGDVGGGRQFRGSVGYSGALDFRGRTGSDDLFQFQRDSFGSGLAARGVRGINGLQDSLGLSTNQLPSSIAGATVLQRESTGVDASSLGGSRGAAGGGGSAINPSTFRAGGLRSLSKSTTDAAAEPVLFAPRAGRPGEQTVGVGASSLRGLYTLPAPGSTTAPPPGAIPRPVSGGAEPQAVPPPRPGAVEPQRVSATATPQPESGKIEVESTYQRLLKQLEEGRTGNARGESPTKPAEGESGAAPAWVRPPEPAASPNTPEKDGEIKPVPLPPPPGAPPGVNDPGAPRPPQPSDDAGLSFEQRLDRLRERLLRGGRASDEAEEGGARADDRKTALDESDEEDESDSAAVRRDTKDLLGAERPKVARFVDPTTDPTALDRHMLAGQEALAKNRWFDAEESFTKAMLARPTDPMPAIGRVHAQLGAGMFLSAAINARAVLRAHPELAAAEYDAALLPRAERLAKVLESLRDAATRDDAFGRDCGLLLAYLGRQTGSPEDVETGLAAVERIEKRLEIPPDPLVSALRTLWVPAAP